MGLIFGAISPHPPLLIPNIGGKNIKQISATKNALTELEQDLYASKPDTLLIISPHGSMSAENFLLNVSAKYNLQFREFGDLATKKQFSGDVQIASHLQEAIEDQEIPIGLVNQPELDHGTGVPLYFLAEHLPDIKILPISFSLLDLETHWRFGQAISQEIAKSEKRIAVIASGDLSHRLNEGAPAGYSPQGKKFDQKIIELVKNQDGQGLLNLDPTMVEEAGECGLRSIIILLAIFADKNYQSKVLSYEGPFGVGYLVSSLLLK